MIAPPYRHRVKLCIILIGRLVYVYILIILWEIIILIPKFSYSFGATLVSLHSYSPFDVIFRIFVSAFKKYYRAPVQYNSVVVRQRKTNLFKSSLSLLSLWYWWLLTICIFPQTSLPSDLYNFQTIHLSLIIAAVSLKWCYSVFLFSSTSESV